jgi:hypothetical protein
MWNDFMEVYNFHLNANGHYARKKEQFYDHSIKTVKDSVQIILLITKFQINEF